MTVLAIILVSLVTILVLFCLWHYTTGLQTRLERERAAHDLTYKKKQQELQQYESWISPEKFKEAIFKETSAITKDAFAMANAYAERRFTEFRNAEISNIREQEHNIATKQALIKYGNWVVDKEADIRADAISRSQAITKGKITEHLVPFFPEFKYDPKDARFSGSPIDLIVYNGLSDGELSEIVFIEVKTGESQLTTRERQVRDCIKNRRVRWEELRVV